MDCRRLDPESSAPEAAAFFLPVAAAGRRRFGDPFQAAADRRLAERYRITCLFPDFPEMPWYADRPDGTVRQESRLLDLVNGRVSGVPRAAPRRRLLIGFNKSGWGAAAFLFRHPESVAAAAAWDAPFLYDSLSDPEMETAFGDETNLRRYRLLDLAETADPELKERPRLLLAGGDLFLPDLEAARRKLLETGVPHLYRDDLRHPHRWDGGWLEEVFRLTLSLL